MPHSPLAAALPASDAGIYSADAPAVLLPYQQRWVADKSPLKVAEKSRRIGLTWAEASDDVLIAAASRQAGGQNVYYIGYNMDMAIEYIEACAMWARVMSQAASAIEEGEEIFRDGNEDRAVKTYTIHFDSGFRIVALSSRPANLRGKQGVIVIDEAAFHGQLDELLKAAIALLIWGGCVRIISTHNGDTNPFNELVTAIRSGARKGSVHRIVFDDAVDEGLYRRVCLRMGRDWSAADEAAWVAEVRSYYGDAATEELDVIPSQGSGAWLTTALIEARMDPAPVLRYTAPDGFERQPDTARHAEIQDWLQLEVGPVLDSIAGARETAFGMDFGRSGDLSVIGVCEITQQMQRRCPGLIELRNMPHRQQEQIVDYVVARLPRMRKAAFDARGNGHALAEFSAQKHGWHRVELVMPTETWYRENMPPLKQAFEDDGIRIPRDMDIRNDLRAVKVVRGVARVPDERGTGRDGGKRHGDAAIALALMYYASRAETAEIEFTAAPAPPRGIDRAPDERGDHDYQEAGARW